MSDDTSPQYALIGREGELLDVVLMRLVACSQCGAAVADTDKHDQWHAEQDRDA